MKIIFCFLLLLTSLVGFSQKIPVLIDSDCGMDDLQAVALLASIKELDIKAFTSVDGNIEPMAGAEKLNNFVQTFMKKTIPIGVGEKIVTRIPEWRKTSMQLSWGEPKALGKAKDAQEVIKEVFAKTNQKITWIALGSLANISKALENQPAIKDKIKKIIWYNRGLSSGFNYYCDSVSAKKLYKSDIQIDIISSLDSKIAIVDSNFVREFKKSNSLIAKHLINTCTTFSGCDKTHSGYRIMDEIVAVYVLYPELFDMLPNNRSGNISLNIAYQEKAVKEMCIRILNGTYSTEKNICFDQFPSNDNAFQYDVREKMDSIIARYGKEEFRAVVITNELHQHLGVLSMVGAKMGLKAREILGADKGRLEVVSFTGNKTPLSCLNDGIQASTGATFGTNNIQLAKDSTIQIAAIFSYNGKKIKLSLKKEFANLNDSETAKGILKYGLLTEGYWKLVRKLALRFWLEWDRNEIFDIKIL